jgi:Holliday junction resolvasome RuvABC DNA-binding subunit
VTLQVIDDEGKSDWEVICATAIEQAKTGDHRAREWLIKNGVSLGGSNATTTKQDPQIVNDAIDALKTVGYKAGEARKIIDSLIKDREYDDLQELIKEALTKKGV